MEINFYVNGKSVHIDISDRKSLLDILRDDLGLTGTKKGCGKGECGACTVLMNRNRVNSCLVPAAQLQNAHIVTIEGLKTWRVYQLVESAFIKHGAVQCGFCTPGFVVSIISLILENHPSLTADQIKWKLGGNMCRCTGYTKIYEAVEEILSRPDIAQIAEQDWDSEFRRVAENQSRELKKIDELDDLIRGTTKEITFLAGGTDLLIQTEKWQSVEQIIDLASVDEISTTIANTGDGVLVGAAVPVSRILSHPLIKANYPILIDACQQIGSVQIQNRATLGGNIANASPAGDSLPVLNVLEAELWIGPKTKGEYKKESIDQIMLNPGEINLGKNDYIAFIYLPFQKNGKPFWYFRKVGQRRALAISKLSLAIIGCMDDDIVKEIKISAGSVSPRVNRAVQTESILTGHILTAERIDRACAELKKEINPISDIRSTNEFRSAICGQLLAEALYGMIEDG